MFPYFPFLTSFHTAASFYPSIHIVIYPCHAPSLPNPTTHCVPFTYFLVRLSTPNPLLILYFRYSTSPPFFTSNTTTHIVGGYMSPSPIPYRTPHPLPSFPLITHLSYLCSPHTSPHSPLAARNHVNRMCLAANIPLVESGTAGYLGQVTVINKVNLQGQTCSY